MSRLLSNYLRTCRRRAGFSQHEVAFLLGAESGAQVSRHEHARRLPSLETLLAYEIVYGAPVRELFAGEFARLQGPIRTRAAQLLRRIQKDLDDPGRSLKLEALAALADEPESVVIPFTEET